MTDKAYNPLAYEVGRPRSMTVNGITYDVPSEPAETEGTPFDRYDVYPVHQVRSPAAIPQSAFDTQVGGSHYKGMKIQPMEYALANNLGYCEATALKYISRWKLKGGIADLDKAIHFIQLLKEYATKHPEEFGL